MVLEGQRLPAFDKVAQLLSRHLDGILAYCHVKMPFGKVEAIAERRLTRRAA